MLLYAHLHCHLAELHEGAVLIKLSITEIKTEWKNMYYWFPMNFFLGNTFLTEQILNELRKPTV